MPLFDYVALTKEGTEKTGTLEVASQNEAISRLKEMGLYPTNVNEVKAEVEDKKGKKGRKGKKGKDWKQLELNIPGLTDRVAPKILATFTRQLATLVDAGLPLVRGMQVMGKQEKHAYLKKVITSIAESIEGGSTFSESLQQFPKIFDKLYVNMVKAGELGGVLEVTLNRLSEFMEKAEKIKGKVKAAMFYPIAVMVVATGIVGLLMVYVVPKFEEIFKDMIPGEDLPAFTRKVLAISNIIKDHFVVTGISLIVSFIILKIVITKTRWGRFGWDWLMLHLPALGPVVSKVAISRFTRTLGTLVASGVPILQALSIVKETAGNEILSQAIMGVYDAVKEGETITRPLEASKVFPPMVISMIDIGEQTGALPEMLIRIANNYDEEVDNAVTAMTSLLEPIMIVFLAVIVGSIVIAMFMPLIVLMDKLGTD